MRVRSCCVGFTTPQTRSKLSKGTSPMPRGRLSSHRLNSWAGASGTARSLRKRPYTAAMRWSVMLGVVLALLVAAAPAEAAAKRCGEPGSKWPRATPRQAGMDATKLRRAVDYGTANAGFAVRVYRHGCLVAEDSVNPESRAGQFESWSLAKSVTALVFGRAMTQELISRH